LQVALARILDGCDDYRMVTLTPELRKALEAAADQPLVVVDPETKQEYVLLRADVYERLHLLFDQGPLSRDEQEALLRHAGQRAEWDGPEMDIYNDLDPHK
jgi:hypothetical protein